MEILKKLNFFLIDTWTEAKPQKKSKKKARKDN